MMYMYTGSDIILFEFHDSDDWSYLEDYSTSDHHDDLMPSLVVKQERMVKRDENQLDLIQAGPSSLPLYSVLLMFYQSNEPNYFSAAADVVTDQPTNQMYVSRVVITSEHQSFHYSVFNTIKEIL